MNISLLIGVFALNVSCNLAVGLKLSSLNLQNCCNWVSSSEPLDTSVESMLPDCPRVSAGMQTLVISHLFEMWSVESFYF